MEDIDPQSLILTDTVCSCMSESPMQFVHISHSGILFVLCTAEDRNLGLGGSEG